MIKVDLLETKQNRLYLVFSDNAPNGVICRDVDLKHWTDKSSYEVEIDSKIVEDVQNILDLN